MHTKQQPAPLAFKPDLQEAAQRWNAFYEGEIIDRPVVCVTAPTHEGKPAVTMPGYHDKVNTDMDTVLEQVLASAQATFWGGEAVPAFFPSFGPDEVAVFCGAELKWSEDSPDTNWSIPLVHDWEQALPIKLQAKNPLWERMLKLYARAAEQLRGKMLISSLDLHTNMDLLAALRGPQQLCMDLMDQPQTIDRAMMEARAVFRELWQQLATAGRMDELGYCHNFYSMEGAAVLQCDFCCMVGPEMFRRWILPALEEEAEIVKHAFFHWDGPDAIKHADDLIASSGLHTLGYVPGTGHGGHIDHLDLLQRVQKGGKAVAVNGTPGEIKKMHKLLRPEKTMYHTSTASRKEAEELLAWFVKNT